MLPKSLRVIIALPLFTALTLFFVDYLGRLPLVLHGLAHIQIVPALFGNLLTIFIVWMLLTLLFGRIYCSAICPLGILKDAVARCLTKHRYKFRKPQLLLRYGLLTACIAGFLLNFNLIVSLLDPYGIYGRMVTHLFRPLVIAGHNLTALVAREQGYHGIWYVQNIISWQSAAVSFATLLLVVLLSWCYGRLYCNTVCPVGATLGLLSRFSLFRVRLREDCISCGLCEQRCKAECIDSKEKTVDASRCVACFNCLNVCKQGSLVYGMNAAKSFSRYSNAANAPAQSRRTFLGMVIAAIGASLGAASNLPTGVSRVPYKQKHPITPPGAGNLERFQQRCTACHLCITKCPYHTIQPAITDYGLSGFLQPVISFEHGYCIFDCVICTQVCPNHALLPISMAEKHHLQIGKVVLILENCVVDTQHTNCGACAEHCPTGAVAMVPFGKPEDALTIPVITDVDLCIGCGACEYICPVRPYRAIYVEGNPVHLEAKPAFDPTEKQQEIKLDDFGFGSIPFPG